MRLGTNRVNTDTADHASWIYEIIDVVGSNYESYSPKGIRCTARRGDDLPWVSGGPVRRKHEKPQHSFDYIVHRPLPPWLLDYAEFQRVADDCFDLWFANRDSGFADLVVFCWYDVCLCLHISLYPHHHCPRQHVKGWS